MDYSDIAMIAAGIIGSGTAVGHGFVLQRVMVRPLEGLGVAGSGVTANVRRLIPILLHFSTFNWLVSGLTLIVAALWLDQETKVPTAILATSSYVFATIGNFSATQGRHYGWMLMAVAVVLSLVGIVGHGL